MCDALIQIRAEVQEIIDGKIALEDSVLRNAPHTMDTVITSNWTRKYSPEQAAFPAPYLRNNKFWPTVARIDGVHGDRNVICTCPPIEDYM